MPIHDWTRVPPHIFDALVHYWIGEISHWLRDRLPFEYVAFPQWQSGPLRPGSLSRISIPVLRLSEDTVLATLEITFGQDGTPVVICSHENGMRTCSYTEKLAAGEGFLDLPVFFEPGRYVPVPLQSTYHSAFADLPQRWKRVLERPAERVAVIARAR